jgi:hypothetical protein
VNIRRITPEERLTLSLPVQAYAFGTSPASADERQRWRAHLPYSTGNTTLVAFDGDAAQAAASAVPMRQNVRGAVLPMAGIAGVAAHPWLAGAATSGRCSPGCWPSRATPATW